MKVVVATSRTQGEQPGDHCFTLEGELVHLPVLECARPDDCGCLRAFAGVASLRATTTAEVAERDLDHDDLLEAVTRALVAGGWVVDGLDDADHGAAAAAYREMELLACEVTADLVGLAARLPVGTVFGRRGPRLLVRRLGPAPSRSPGVPRRF